MRRRQLCSALAAVAALCVAAAARSEEPYAIVKGPAGTVKTPLFSEERTTLAVAKVEDRVVTLQEFAGALSAVHESHGDADKAGGKDFTPVLDRLIGARLISIEAHDMGLDELPEVKKAVAAYQEQELRAQLERRLSRDAKPNPNQADLYYREAVREWQLKSILFAKEADARAMWKEAKAGSDYDALTAAAVATKKGQGGQAGDFVPLSAMMPQVATAVQNLWKGQVSEPIQVQGGWAVAQIADIRYPENPAARAEAEARALADARDARLRKAYEDLVRRNTVIRKKFLDKLDFEKKKPGFAALEKDKRLLAQIKGGKDITVADLTAAMKATFFHGVEDALKLKRVNETKYSSFNKMLYHRLLDAEAAKQGIAATPEYKRAIDGYRESVVFEQFIKRAVLPGVQVTEAEGKAYYEKHKGEFVLPAYYTLQSLSFTTAGAAEAALKKLKAGTDLKWLRANADGKVPDEKRNLTFDGNTVSARGLPAELLAKLKGTRPGDLRLYAQEGQHHLVVVTQVTAESQQPYAQVRADIGRKLSSEKTNQAVGDWVAKLRKAHDVKVYLTQIGS